MDLGRRLSPRARTRSALLLGIAVAGTLAGGCLIGLSHHVLPFVGWPSLGSRADVQQRLAAAPDLVRSARREDSAAAAGAPRGFASLAGGAPLAAAGVRVSFQARESLSATTSTIGAGTATHDRDSDNDGIPDSVEARMGSNPRSADSDGDGLPDGWERQHDLDPSNAQDASAYSDGDGLSNATV